MTRTAKQVIVMRKDLNMRKGKMVAQGAHASLGAWFLLHEEAMAYEKGDLDEADDAYVYSLSIYEAANAWFRGLFTKICVSVNSEDELHAIVDKAHMAKLPVKLIHDAGLTEFGGVPTYTCLAIGPAWAEGIDKITGHLPLL